MIHRVEELGYFQNDPPEVLRHKSGRLTASGVILLLAAAATAIPVVLIAYALTSRPQFRPSGREMPSVILVWTTFLSATILFVWSAIGAFRRQRWSRTVIVATACLWLVIGIVFFGSMVPGIVEELQFVWQYPQIIWSMLMPPAIVATAGVIFPTSLLLLLGPRSVEATIRHHDLRPRWTDTWGIGAVTIVATLLISTAVQIVIFTDVFHEDWLDASPILRGCLPVTAAFDLVAAAAAIRRRPIAVWIGLVVTVVHAVMLALSADYIHFAGAQYQYPSNDYVKYGSLLTLLMAKAGVLYTQRRQLASMKFADVLPSFERSPFE